MIEWIKKKLNIFDKRVDFDLGLIDDLKVGETHQSGVFTYIRVDNTLRSNYKSPYTRRK